MAAIDYDYNDEQARFDRKYVTDNEFLGRGSFGTVVLGYDTNQDSDRRNWTKVAIKKPHAADGWGDKLYKNSELLVGQALEEVKIWSRLSSDPSPFILPLLDFFVLRDPIGLPTLYTVTPYMKRGDLHTYIKERSCSKKVSDGGLTKNECRIIAKQILSAVQHMAACGVVHRDIKPDNMMVVLRRNRETFSFVKILLIDFGTATFYREGEDDPLQTNVGTDWFQAPEVGVAASGQGYGIAAELYSVGQTLKVTYRGYWTDDHLRNQYIEDAANDVYKVLWHKNWNLEQASLGLETDALMNKILQLTEDDPTERPSLEEAVEMFAKASGLTAKQSRQFEVAGQKILKVVNAELHEARAKIAGLQGDLEAAKERVQTITEASQTIMENVTLLQERLESQDAGNEVSGTITDDA